jgi:hypothetical protein
MDTEEASSYMQFDLILYSELNASIGVQLIKSVLSLVSWNIIIHFELLNFLYF